MGPGLRNWLLAGTLLGLGCLFMVRFSNSSTDTLIGAIGDIVSSGPHDLTMLVTVPCVLVILMTVCLPPLLWLELAVSRRPLSRRTRFLLIAQGLVGFVGVALTGACMLIPMLHVFGGSQSDDVSSGFGVILAAETVFALTSLVLGLRRPGAPAATPPPPP